MNTAIDFASILLGGLAAGTVLFIVSVGLSVTMGLMGFVNLAHGAFAMFGGYIIVLAMNRAHFGFAAALVLGFLGTAALSIFLEQSLYRHLIERHPESERRLAVRGANRHPMPTVIRHTKYAPRREDNCYEWLLREARCK